MQQIEQACARLGIAFQLIDTHSGYVAELSKEGRTVVLGVGPINAYPLNSATAVSLAQDKGYAALLLQRAGLPVPEGDYFFIANAGKQLRNTGKGVADAIRYAKELGYPLIAKPLKGSRGNGVQPVYDETDLRTHLRRLSKQHYAAMLQRPVYGVEYRVFAIDGVPKFMYTKQAQALNFDSVVEFHNFLKEENQRRRAAYLLPYEINSGFVKHLKLQVSQGNSIRWSAMSVNTGQAKVADFRMQVPTHWDAVCEQVYQALNLRVFALDIILTEGTPDQPKDFVILEVNGNPMLDSANHAPDPVFVDGLWQEILEKSF